MNILLICIGFFILLFIIIFIIQSIKIRNLSTKPRNRVRFFVTKERNICEVSLILWMGTPKWDNKRGVWVPSSMHNHYLSSGDRFLEEFNIDPNDFTDMKECEIREVFINLKD